MGEPKPEKPYKLESVSKPWTETDVETWWLTIMDFLKSAPRYKKSLAEVKEWKPKRITNRGLTGADAADKADVESELLKVNPKNVSINEILLSKATYNLNSKIRFTKRSARELLLKRDQTTGDALEIED